MAFDINKIQQTPTAPVSSSKPTAPAAPNSIITAAGTTNIDEVKTNQTPLDKALAEVLGENYPQIKEGIQRIIEKFGIHAPKNKKELTEEKIKKIAEKIQKLVDNLKAKKLDITAENLFQEACNVIDMKILDKNGISLADYKKAVENGEAKSLRELLGLQEGEEVTEEKVAAYAQKVVKEAQERIKNSPNPAEVLKEEIAAQKKQFALCLVSTPIEDRAKLMGAIEHVYADNKGSFVKDILLSLTPEARIEFANQIGLKKIHKWFSSADANGNYCSNDEQIGVIAEIKQYQNADKIKSDETEFMAQAREFFAREDVIGILNKIKNKEELTEAEQAIAKEIETYTAYSAGSQIGTANSVVLSEESINELLQLMNRDAYELPNYRDVLGQIKSFIENEDNAEYLNLSKEELVKLFDKASNGNYSIVANTKEGEPLPELNAPKDPNATSGADLGFKTTVETPNYSNVGKVYETILAQTPVEETEFVIEKEEKPSKPSKSELSKHSLHKFAEYGSEGIKFYIETFGKKTFIKNAITENAGQYAETEAERIYTNYSSNEQAQMASSTASYKVGKTLLDWFSGSLDKINEMGSFALTQRLNEDKKEQTNAVG